MWGSRPTITVAPESTLTFGARALAAATERGLVRRRRDSVPLRLPPQAAPRSMRIV
jgi:hypothetical protein